MKYIKDQENLEGKVILLRLDLNVPLKNLMITDETRINKILPVINFLIKKKAINIHMGISPYYRGTDCNFWALYDCKPELVGATLHLISKGIDNGKIIANATSEYNKNPFLYTMSTVKSAFFCLSSTSLSLSAASVNSLTLSSSSFFNST